LRKRRKESAEATQDSEKYTEGGSYEQETVKAGGWIYSQFILWKNFFVMAGEKNDQAEFEDITTTLAKYIPEDIGLLLIPCYIRNFITYRAEVIADNTKVGAIVTGCPCEFWLSRQQRGACLDPLLKYVRKHAQSKDKNKIMQYEYIPMKHLNSIALVREDILNLCKALHAFESPNIEFNGEASRLFLINCCHHINPNMKLIDAIIEVSEKAPVDIAGSYRNAAAEEKREEVIDSYFSTSFANLRESSGRSRK